MSVILGASAGHAWAVDLAHGSALDVVEGDVVHGANMARDVARQFARELALARAWRAAQHHHAGHVCSVSAVAVARECMFAIIIL